MKLGIAWDPAALFVFYRLPVHAATLVDRVVIRFAETGEGTLEWVAPYYRLQAGGFDVVLAIDTHAQTLTVLRLYRART